MSPTKAGTGLAVLVATAILGLLAGCAVPPAPARANPAQRTNGDQDPDEGWLFKNLTGRNRTNSTESARTEATAMPASPQGVAAGAYAPNSAGSTPSGPVPPSYPGYTPQGGYKAPSQTQANPAYAPPVYQAPPPANPAYAPPAYQPASANPGYVNSAAYQVPATSDPRAAGSASTGLVPVGASGVARMDRDVVPAGVTNMPPASPGVPGGSSSGSPEPIVASPVRADGKKSDDDSGFDLAKLAPENVWKNIKNASGFGPDEKIARQAFQEGEALFRQKQYDEAAKKFYTASWRWPDSTLEEDSMFLLGECYFFADRYSNAHDAYANLLKKHENSRYLDTVMTREFAVARYWEQVDDKSHVWPMVPNLTDKTRPWFDTHGNALGAYESVRLHDPTGPLADSAIMATANNHFRRQEWEEAAYNYDLLRKDYAKSQFQKDAHVLGLQSKLRIYQGPLYAHEPLDDAKEIADQTLTQFRGRLGEEENRMAETRAHIVEQKAEREWMMGQYFERKKYFGAARQYYKIVIENYPQTRLAEQSRIRLQQIQNEPDSPPNRFPWLTRLFERER